MDDSQKIVQERLAFDYRYSSQEEQIIILTPNSCRGAGKSGGDLLWSASQYLIAYIDCDSGELIEVNDRVVWQVTEEQYKQKSATFDFQPLTAYKLLVRRAKPANKDDYKFMIDNGMDVPDLSNHFMLLKVLTDNVIDARLQQVLDVYNAPVFIEDSEVGKLELDKDLDLYQGNTFWLGQQISIYISDSNDADNKLAVLKSIINEAADWDHKLRQFSAIELTDLANDWQNEDEDADNLSPITTASFADRISLRELSISDDGDFTVYYHDDDMFWGHIIMVSGNIDGTLSDASIAG